MPTKDTLEELLENADPFVRRHIGPRPEDAAKMLDTLNLAGMDELVQKTVAQAKDRKRPWA